jgi:hypothetical protein
MVDDMATIIYTWLPISNYAHTSGARTCFRTPPMGTWVGLALRLPVEFDVRQKRRALPRPPQIIQNTVEAMV